MAASDAPLNQISTLWSLVCRASEGPAQEVSAAQRELLLRYSRAVHRYLVGALRDPDAADELAQEFALRFIRGDFHGADPGQGRFRDFLKGVLFHLIADHHRRRRPAPLPGDGAEVAAAPGPEMVTAEREFVEGWRGLVLARTWEALAEVQRQTGRPLHDVLRLKAQHPDLRSPELAERAAVLLARPVTAAGVRQILHRAREKFADLLLGEVAQTLETPTPDRLEQELLELGLLDYCREALRQYRPAPQAPESGQEGG